MGHTAEILLIRRREVLSESFLKEEFKYGHFVNMAPHRKRQRISEDGKAAPTATSNGQEIGDHAAPKGAQSQQKPTRSLFVRSLAATTTNDDLTEHFSQSYPIKHATVVIDSATKQCKGYGFVTFADVEDAQRAKEEFDGSSLQGKKLKVEFAEPRQRGVENGEEPKDSKPSKPFRDNTQQPPPKLIVRNLPWSIKKPDQLAALFRSYGKVNHIVLPKKGDEMAGFGIVLIRGRKNAEKAIEGINGKEVDGRTLAVDWAVDKDTWEKVKEEAKIEENGQVESETQAKQAPVDGDEENEQIVEEEQLIADSHDLDASSEVSSISDDADEEHEFDTEGSDDEEEQPRKSGPQDMPSTIFIRNLPFTCTDDDLFEHFQQFGPVRYARVVLDRETERPRGTGFVCFYKLEDAEAYLKDAPRHQAPQLAAGNKSEKVNIGRSVLQDIESDPTGNYTMDGRILQISLAVAKNEATRLTEEGVAKRFARDKDKRRLYLLSEGTIASNSPLYQSLSPSEVAMREASLKQRKALIDSNPSLHLSLTRLSIRNIPRSLTSKDLKALAREAVVGFAQDVKGGKRLPLSKEEKSRGGDEMKEAEKSRKLRAKGIVKQAKIIFEGREGSKVTEQTGAGRSRGYGFIEYHTHRSALMGLRWLNGHAITYSAKETKGKGASREELQDRKKRLIVEFAIENAQVVARRKDMEKKTRDGPRRGRAEKGEEGEANGDTTDKFGSKRRGASKKQEFRKRKRDSGNEKAAEDTSKSVSRSAPAKDEKLAKREKIIQRKRMLRRTRKKQRSA